MCFFFQLDCNCFSYDESLFVCFLTFAEGLFFNPAGFFFSILLWEVVTGNGKVIPSISVFTVFVELIGRYVADFGYCCKVIEVVEFFFLFFIQLRNPVSNRYIYIFFPPLDRTAVLAFEFTFVV